MRISELIKRLQDIKEENDDLIVTTGTDFTIRVAEIEDVSVEKGKDYSYYIDGNDVTLKENEIVIIKSCLVI